MGKSMRRLRGKISILGLLAYPLRQWHSETPYAKDTDFVFASLKKRGRVLLSACAFVKDHLRQAASAAGVVAPKGVCLRLCAALASPDEAGAFLSKNKSFRKPGDPGPPQKNQSIARSVFGMFLELCDF